MSNLHDLIQQLKRPGDNTAPIENQIADNLSSADNETLAFILRFRWVTTARLYDRALREAIARLLSITPSPPPGPQPGSREWFTLEPGQMLYAWYEHPGALPAIVILSGFKHHPGVPYVEWLEKWRIPKELADNQSPITADELPGRWGECSPPSQMALSHWVTSSPPPAAPAASK